jgi:hypothetical protein
MDFGLYVFGLFRIGQKENPEYSNPRTMNGVEQPSFFIVVSLKMTVTTKIAPAREIFAANASPFLKIGGIIGG